MDSAIQALRQSFTRPSAAVIRHHPMCRICWNNYQGGDQPVILPCGHVFGEECIISWARRVTPRGRHNGCPFCGAELLPPSLQSRRSVLGEWLAFVCWVIRRLIGGRQGIALTATLWVARTYAESRPESKVARIVAFGAHVLFTMLVTRRSARLVGPEWARCGLVIGVMVAIFTGSGALAKPTLGRSGFVEDQAG